MTDQIQIFFLAEECLSAWLAVGLFVKDGTVPLLVTRRVRWATSLHAFSPDLDVVWVRALADSPLACCIGRTPCIALIPENPEFL